MGNDSQRLQDMRKEVVNAFAGVSGLRTVESELVERFDGPYLVLTIANPADRFYALLSKALESVSESNEFRDRTTLRARKAIPKSRLDMPEVHLLRRVLSEISTISSKNFDPDRYVRSVAGAEEQVSASSNHVVYGRRGSGKSSLLAYHLNELKASETPYAWFDMQVYSGSAGTEFVADVLVDLLRQVDDQLSPEARDDTSKLVSVLTDVAFGTLEVDGVIPRLLPRIKRMLSSITARCSKLVIFIDDIHVIRADLQPYLLAQLYSLSRGSNVFLKISGIEQLTKLWDPVGREGLEAPHDAQIITLDYNLTMPDKSKEHIQRILDGHAEYSGLNSVKSICNKNVIDRLVFASAGVPRDAINVFSQAIARSLTKGQRLVSVAAVNEASSLGLDEKLRNMQTDASASFKDLKATLDRVQAFCVDSQKRNAFLVRILPGNDEYQDIQELVGLRMLHVLHEGFTPEEAGERFVALMLDFGFYVGIRAARSVSQFQTTPKRLLAKDLRDLPRYNLQQAAK